MADDDRRTIGYNLGIILKDLPMGEATWQFTTRADEKGVEVGELVRVALKDGSAGSDDSGQR